MGGYTVGYSDSKQRADNKEMVELELLLEAETEKAVLVDGAWLPKSQIEIVEYFGSHIHIKCPRWLATDRKLI